jgi:hypothetical protein
LSQFTKNYTLVPYFQKIVTNLSKIWVWYPGSGKTFFRIPGPGVEKCPDPDPQHLLPENGFFLEPEEKLFGSGLDPGSNGLAESGSGFWQAKIFLPKKERTKKFHV